MIDTILFINPANNSVFIQKYNFLLISQINLMETNGNN